MVVGGFNPLLSRPRSLDGMKLSDPFVSECAHDQGYKVRYTVQRKQWSTACPPNLPVVEPMSLWLASIAMLKKQEACGRNVPAVQRSEEPRLALSLSELLRFFASIIVDIGELDPKVNLACFKVCLLGTMIVLDRSECGQRQHPSPSHPWTAVTGREELRRTHL